MSNTFVIPDIHGRLDLLNDGLAEIAARSKGETGTIVTIGDYVDKGTGQHGRDRPVAIGRQRRF